MRTARVLVMAIAVAAFTMLVASGPGTRMGLWPWETGLSLMKWATYTGLAAGIGSGSKTSSANPARWFDRSVSSAAF